MSEHPDDDQPSGVDELSVFEHRFVEAYMGEAKGVGSVAVHLAGGTLNSRSAASIACHILKRPKVKQALKERIENDPLVAGRLERLRFLTAVLRGQETEVRLVVTHRKSKKEGGGWETERVHTPASIADRIAAARDLAKAAGEHLPTQETDNAAENLLQLIANLGVERVFALVTKGETRQ